MSTGGLSLPVAAKEPIQVGYLGPMGTYSHEIARKSFPEPAYELIPYHSIRDTIYSLLNADGPAHPYLAIVPIENSSFGPVQETHDVLNELSVSRNTHVLVERLRLKIQHCLVARKPLTPSSPSVASPKLESPPIQEIFSHVQALGQCKQYLGLHYPNAKQVPTLSTVEAAQAVAKDLTCSSLAICSAGSLAYFPALQIIDSNIQDAGQENITTFITLQRNK